MPILTPEERVGATLAGKYRLDRIIAAGGMATVYAGVHAWTERTVAVKILNYEHARDPEVVRRFLQEARAAAQLKHPNVVDVLDMGQDDDGTVYLVLELLEGETLKAHLKRGALGIDDVRQLLVPIMRAVASAHAKAVVHRDLKPDNVFIARSAHGEVVPKLLDFGIAKVQSGDSSSTRTGMMVGTPQYMAPEQVRGERDVGPRADVWSMGVVLFYTLSRKMPFSAESPAGVLAKVLTERARPVRDLAPAVPEALAAVVDRALQHDAGQRFADMNEMLLATEAALIAASSGARSTDLLEASPVAVPSGEVEVLVSSSFLGTPASLPSLPPAPLGEPAAVVSPSEYPAAASTPFSWGTTEGEDAPPGRSAGPLLGVGAALLLLVLGGTTAWLVISAEEPASGSTVVAARPSPTPAVVPPVAVPPVVVPPVVVATPVAVPPVVVATPVAVPPVVVATPVAVPRVVAPVAPPATPTRTATPTRPATSTTGAQAPDRARPELAATTRALGDAGVSASARPTTASRRTEAEEPGRGPRRGTRGALILR